MEVCYILSSGYLEKRILLQRTEFHTTIKLQYQQTQGHFTSSRIVSCYRQTSVAKQEFITVLASLT